VVQASIDTLTDQARTIEKIVCSLGLEPSAFEGSESLDNPEAVFQEVGKPLPTNGGKGFPPYEANQPA
jgi:hypothetical protein